MKQKTFIISGIIGVIIIIILIFAIIFINLKKQSSTEITNEQIQENLTPISNKTNQLPQNTNKISNNQIQISHESISISNEQYQSLKNSCIAYISHRPPTPTEDEHTYLYTIYKKDNGTYSYKEIEIINWTLDDQTQIRIISSGNINIKEDLGIIKNDIQHHSYTPTFSTLYIFYLDEQLNSIEQLADILFSDL